MKIYTKAGDDGSTALLGPGRIRKDAARIEAYGTVDELNALLGMARAAGQLDPTLDGCLEGLQSELFDLGAALADPAPAGRFHGAIGSAHIERLEHWIDETEAQLAPLTSFILPGGTPAAAALHLARTVCRRAERRVITLADVPSEHVPAEVVIYLNRLSDLLFVLARRANQSAGRPDVIWRGRGG